MRGKVARILRARVYGHDYSPKHKRYRRFVQTGQIVADEKRAQYQAIKKHYRERG